MLSPFVIGQSKVRHQTESRCQKGDCSKEEEHDKKKPYCYMTASSLWTTVSEAALRSSKRRIEVELESKLHKRSLTTLIGELS